MVVEKMDAVIHYRHAPEEIVDLELAIAPLMDSIRRVATKYQRASLKRILGCEFFRAREAATMRNMLIRAVKYSRASLNEYFPLMQQDVLLQAQALEDAVNAYWTNFRYLREEILPVH
jgi:hypothetical protein